MRRFLTTLTIALICGILATPTIEAQNRRGGRNGSTTEQTQRSNRNSANGNERRQSSQSSRNNNSNRVDNKKKANAQQPANNGNMSQGQRPGNNRQPANNGNMSQGQRPGNNRQPANNGNMSQGQRPGNKPQPPHNNHHYGDNNRPTHVAPPSRPHRPQQHVYHRPVPPPTIVYHSRCPVITTILGIQLGTAFNVSLNYLYRNGYIVDGYGNDMIYLRNATQLSLNWPDAILHYGPNGLIGSEFSYSTSYYDMSRFNIVYSTFVTQYGSPISYSSSGDLVTATWWGHNGYVQLQFNRSYSHNGQLRYYTILSFGL